MSVNKSGLRHRKECLRPLFGLFDVLMVYDNDEYYEQASCVFTQPLPLHDVQDPTLIVKSIVSKERANKTEKTVDIITVIKRAFESYTD